MPGKFKPLCEDYGCYRGDEVDALRAEVERLREGIERLAVTSENEYPSGAWMAEQLRTLAHASTGKEEPDA